VFRVPRCGIRRLLQVVDFSDGFVISKNRIVNEAVTWSPLVQWDVKQSALDSYESKADGFFT